MAAYTPAVTTVPSPKPMTAKPGAVQAAAGAVRPTGVLGALQALTPSQQTAFQQYVGARTQGAAPGAGPNAVPGSTPLQLPAAVEAGYLNDQNTINEGANSQLATNEHDTNAARTAYGLALTRMNSQQLDERNAEPEAFVGRGIFHSGLQNDALSHLDIAHANQQTDFGIGREATMNQFHTQRQQIEYGRAAALAANKAKHQQALNAYAAKSVIA
jgi:hypothetical protein